MPKFSQPARTVRDIKTLAGKAEDLHTPHKMYMRLFALETERHRRQQERESAMLRVTNIDARCVEIDQEKELLLQLLGVESIPQVPPSAAASSATKGSARAQAGDPRRRGRLTTQSTPIETGASEAVKIRY